jgi:predicted P-loop ATPase
MVKSITIQIGNSDDKLTQKEWAEFVQRMDGHIHYYANDIHFFGGSENYAKWQNVCWVITFDENEDYPGLDLLSFKSIIQKTREEFRQTSVAWIEGEAQFI